MSLNNEDRPIYGRYSILRKNFIRDFVLATFFIFCFAGVFLIGWDVWIIPSGFKSSTIWYCVGVSIAASLVLTVPISFIMNWIEQTIEKHKRKKEQLNHKKDFLEE